MEKTCLILFSCLFLLIGCESKDDLIQEIQEENHNMKESISIQKQKLIETNIKLKELSSKNSTLTNELQEALQKTEELNNAILNTRESLRDMNINNVFVPMSVKKGDIIAGLKVLEVEKEATAGKDELYSYSVLFEGEFEVSGEVFWDNIEGQGYVIRVPKNQMVKLPHTTDDLISMTNRYYILINNTDEFNKLVGRTVNQLSEDTEMKIEASFSHYTYRHIEDKGVIHTATVEAIRAIEPIKR
jgi:uncharacterized protein YcfL